MTPGTDDFTSNDLEDLAQAIKLLSWKLDDDPCDLNHRGECETHGGHERRRLLDGQGQRDRRA